MAVDIEQIVAHMMEAVHGQRVSRERLVGIGAVKFRGTPFMVIRKAADISLSRLAAQGRDQPAR